MVWAGGAASLLFVGDSAPDLGSDTPDMTLDALSGDSLSTGVSAAEFTTWYWSVVTTKDTVMAIQMSNKDAQATYIGKPN